MSTEFAIPSLFPENGIPFMSRDTGTYRLSALSRETAAQHVERLLEIHALIPNVHSWTAEEILANENAGRVYLGKWLLSAIITDGEGADVAGFILAYFRRAGPTFPTDAVYIHRLAISAEHQRRGVGTKAVRLYLTSLYQSIPWLLNVAVQTNDTAGNEGIIEFYENIGFNKFGRVYYPNKVDWLLTVDRKALMPTPQPSEILPLLPHPYGPSCRAVPSLFMGTSSEIKFRQFEHLFKSFNIDLKRSSVPVDLTEPQVEAGSDSELNLVLHPLKQAARFISASNNLPFLVEDTMLFIEFFNQDYEKQPELPGADTKRWWRQLGAEGVLKIMGDTHRRRARYVSQIGAYLEPGKYVLSRGEVIGSIALEACASPQAKALFPATNPWYFHTIFMPAGSTETLAEMGPQEFALYDYRRISVQNLLNQVELRDKLQMEFFYPELGESPWHLQ